VFTPYWRAWQAARWRGSVATPRQIRLPHGVTGDDPRSVVARLARRAAQRGGSR